MPTLPNIRNFNLKVVFMIHFAFIAVGAIGYWSRSSFLFYNSILILLLIWSMHNVESEEPIQLAIVVNGISIILDIILLCMCFPDSHEASERFSAAMAILNLILRPFSLFVLMKNLEERTGTSGLFDNSSSGGVHQPSNYQDIDKNIPRTSQHGGYDFTNAQQI